MTNMWQIATKLFIVSVFNWELLAYGDYIDYYDDDLNTLGERISARVQAQVAPLQGLGQRISNQVQRDLEPMRANLHNLGQRISDQVYQGLEPVRAIELNFKMRDGVGGTTIATHFPSGKKFIIKNYQLVTCSGEINDNTGDCSGNAAPFQITPSSDKTDWCYVRNHNIINNQICISTGNIYVQAVNNIISCKSSDSRPTLIIALDEYKKMCQNVSQKVMYKYLANEDDPRHVEIPNKNAHVKCMNKERGVCVFSEDNGLLTSYFGGGVIINNGGSFVYGN